MSINQTRFFNNTGAQGGALAAGNGTTVDISSSVFDSNVASNGGERFTLRHGHLCRYCNHLPSCTVSLRNLHLDVSRVAGSLTMPHSIHTAALCPAGSIYLSGVNSALLYNVTAKGNTALTNGGGLFSVSNSHTGRHPACSPVSLHWLHTHPIYSAGPHRPVTFCRI